uniref:Uncharacterized protein n=1 Tax=Neisseria leonii TaxID=2995413 RepID=A0A9X4DZH9_9NEIS|nr:hypothetical protein [Neisseria sp. 51.81]MDD9326733.1 hypothetical protein [Neisseria sp. 51.81]
MNVYPVPSRVNGYDGAGLVMAAVSHGEAVKLAYLRDICPDYDGKESPSDWLVWGGA